jgi:plastocyanin
MRNSRTLTRPAAIVAVLALLVAAACSSDGGNEATTVPPAATSAPAESSAPPAANTVTITMVDFAFDPVDMTASVTQALHLVNDGSALHNFSIEGTVVDFDVEAGQTLNVPGPAPIDPGSYTVFCKYHRAQGMEGTIEVTP